MLYEILTVGKLSSLFYFLFDFQTTYTRNYDVFKHGDTMDTKSSCLGSALTVCRYPAWLIKSKFVPSRWISISGHKGSTNRRETSRRVQNAKTKTR